MNDQGYRHLRTIESRRHRVRDLLVQALAFVVWILSCLAWAWLLAPLLVRSR